MQAVTGDSREVLRFAGFELDIGAYELRRNGQSLRLEQQPMDLLILLVQRRPELVLRTQIVERHWGRDTFVDAEAGINTLVRKIRQALKDSAASPAFIERVPGKGYRFIAPVEIARADSRALESGPDRSSSGEQLPPVTRRRSRRAATISALIAVAAATAAYWALPGSSETVIGVLPFENIGVPADMKYLAEALHEETITALNQLDHEHLSAKSRLIMLRYRDSVKSPGEIGRELEVDYLLRCAIQTEDTQVRMNWSLIRVRDERVVYTWTSHYQPRRMLEFQRELSSMVAEQISLKLSPNRLANLARRHSRNEDAVRLYFQGQNYWNQLTPQTTKRAVEYFEAATRQDPGYALAWAGIAVAYAAAPINADADPQAVWPKARDAADRAMRADPTLAEAQTALGVVQFWLDWKWPAAEASLMRAIEIDPHYAIAQRMLGIVRSHMRNPAAETSMNRLRVLEPGVAMNHALSAQVAFNAGQFEVAADHANQAALVDPPFWIARYQAAMALEQLREYDRALAAITPVTHVNSKALSLQGYVFAKAGQTAEARGVLSTLQRNAETRYVPPYAFALVHAGLGERDAALQQLERAFEVHDVHLSALPVDPKWNSFRQDPRFMAILERCGFTP